MGESQSDREPHLGGRDWVGAGAGERRVGSTVKEGRLFEGGRNGGQAKRTSLVELGESMSG